MLAAPLLCHRCGERPSGARTQFRSEPEKLLRMILPCAQPGQEIPATRRGREDNWANPGACCRRSRTAVRAAYPSPARGAKSNRRCDSTADTGRILAARGVCSTLAMQRATRHLLSLTIDARLVPDGPGREDCYLLP